MMRVSKFIALQLYNFLFLVLYIAWMRAEYTVREEEGTVEVCAEITGKQTVSIAIHQVRLYERTARDGIGK